MGLATIRLWDDEECQRVHEATLRVLHECGVEVKYEPALKRFAEIGARVEGTRVPARSTTSGRRPCYRPPLMGGQVEGPH